MAWTAPSTVATDGVLTAAIWNEQVRDNENYLKSRKLEFANSADEDKKFQRGTVSVALSTAATGSAAVTYPTAFAVAPDIVTQALQTSVYPAWPQSITTTGFDAHIRHIDGTALTVTITVQWWAIG